MEAVGGVLNINVAKSRQRIKAEKYVMHQKYVDFTKENDIALVFLKSPFNQTDTFSVLKMSDQDPVDDEPCRAGM